MTLPGQKHIGIVAAQFESFTDLAHGQNGFGAVGQSDGHRGSRSQNIKDDTQSPAQIAILETFVLGRRKKRFNLWHDVGIGSGRNETDTAARSPHSGQNESG